MYVIVVGAGAIGSQVIDLLTRSSHNVVVVEQNADRAQEASQLYDCIVINDDATVQETLIDTGIEDADAVISTTDEDATNIMVMLLAKEFDVPSLVSVVQNDEHMGLFRQVGANVIENPQRLIGEYLVRAVQRPSVKDFMTLNGGAEVFEITVEAGAPIAERSLRDADQAGMFDDDVLVVAIERNDEVLTPKGNVTVHGGDLVTVFSRRGASNEIAHIFTGE